MLWDRYVSLWERNVALWESNVTKVFLTQRHIKLLMICRTVKPVEDRENYVYKIVNWTYICIFYVSVIIA